MRFESNCMDEEEKVVCLELGEYEFEIKGKKIDPEEVEGEVTLLVDKKELDRVVKKVKNIFRRKPDGIEADDYSVKHIYKVDNGNIIISYDTETFEPEWVFFYISEVDVGYTIAV